jgi:hypothetical protein
MVGNILVRFGANLKTVNDEPGRTRPISKYHSSATVKNKKGRAILPVTTARTW